MADRPGVKTAPMPETAVTLAELGARMATTMATLPLHQPWRGPESVVDNTVHESVREILKTLMTYALTLSTPRLRSLEKFLDDLCRAVLRPIATRDGVTVEDGAVGGIPGVWVRPAGRPRATVIYLHGGGYLATTPWMYAMFTAGLVRATGCDLFIVDYRLAPEFPFPAGLEDAMKVFETILEDGRPRTEIFVAGDSGGGGLATSLFEDARAQHLPEPAGAILFSPEVDLVMGEPSVKANARHDVLPDQIPVIQYLGSADPKDPRVSVVYADVHRFPTTFIAYGGEEMFCDEIEEFVGKLKKADVEVTTFKAPYLFHVYEILMPWADASKETIASVVQFVDQQLDR
ncbi:MAG: alpha/beta hydrolase [Acidimicrobiia bacterium]